MSAVDVKSFGKVAVLMGGKSAEREVSLMSGSGVLKALQSRGVDAHAFDPAERDLSELKKKGFRRCFIALHGRFGEDGTVQGALELLGIPYTGSGVMASSIAIDKVMTKRVWLAEGIPTPKYKLLHRGNYTREQVIQVPDELGLPVIVKPAREGLHLVEVHPGVVRDGHLAATTSDRAVFANVEKRQGCRGGDEQTKRHRRQPFAFAFGVNHQSFVLLPLVMRVRIVAHASRLSNRHAARKCRQYRLKRTIRCQMKAPIDMPD